MARAEEACIEGSFVVDVSVAGEEGCLVCLRAGLVAGEVEDALALFEEELARGRVV